jgi:GAF domain-containing protein
MHGSATGAARWEAQHTVILADLLTVLAADGNLHDTLAAIAAPTAAALRADSAWFALASGWPRSAATSPPRSPQETPPASPDSTAPLQTESAGSLAVPLVRDETFYGTLHLRRDRSADAFADDEITLARAIAGYATSAIVRARRDAEAQRRVERAEALREIGRVLSTELDYGRFLEVTREQVARIIDHGSCWLAHWDEAADELDCRFYMADGKREPGLERRLKRGTGLAWTLVDERKTLNTPDYLGECRRRGWQATGRGDTPRTETNPWLGVPLLAGGRLVGVMAVQRLGAPFSDEEAATLELLAGQIAAALENTRLFAEARQLASCDALTGLANHRALQEQIDIELARATRNGTATHGDHGRSRQFQAL